ncbi:MAG: hypothetical protein HC871_15210 [Rhizobiales bacterium]|nr:hypothetical protein [Hyphomicrobiales bacterium]
MPASSPETITLRAPDLRQAAEQGVIDAAQSDALWRFLADRARATPATRFDMAHLLWYTGALIVIGAMGLFSTLAFGNWGGQALATTAAVYALMFTVLGVVLRRRELATPGGLCIAVAVTMAPLFVFGIQESMGWWLQGDPGNYRDFYRWIKGGWLPMEIATVAAGLIALTFVRFPFLTAPIAVALWFMSMDLVPWIFGEDWSSWEQRRIVSLWFGLGMIALAWWVDLKARDNLAFWLHLFGMMAFWGGLSFTDSDSELAKAVYCLINAGLLAASVFLQRRVYAVFGALGVTGYLGHLAGQVFRDSLLYPFALSFIGLLILGAGVLFHRHQDRIERALRSSLPATLDHLRPAHAREAHARDR